MSISRDGLADCFVVGSGPTGIAAATALLDRGKSVTMIDAGTEIEPERARVARELAARDPVDWTREEMDRLRGAAAETPPGRLPVKRTFGSDFAYARGELRTVEQQGTNCLMSFARGGLTNVWGAAVLSNRAADMEDWPIVLGDLGPHYERVRRFMPIAAVEDDLERLFPFYGAPSTPLRRSALADAIAARIRTRRAELDAAGIVGGQSRLAVTSQADDQEHGCRYAGTCLIGCPYSAIWNAGFMIDALRQRPGFRYEPGWRVHRIERGPDCARLVAQPLGASSARAFDADRVFLACGPLSTLRIVADSIGLYDRALPLRYQPYFVLPLAALGPVPDVEHERAHTLAQLFIEILDPAISARTVHLQLYTFNEYMRERVERATRWLGPLKKPMRSALARRLMAIQGYLHSDHAAPIRVTAARADGEHPARLTLTAPPSHDVRRVVGRIVRKLSRHCRAIGAVPLAALKTLGLPGEGNHVGASFPMRRTPGPLDTNVAGEMAELPRVHIVDASSLPSLAATTITYTAMANAHRIADTVATGGAQDR